MMTKNKDCPYKDTSCYTDLECLQCSYDYLIKKELYVEADKMYVQHEKLMPKVERHSVLFDELRREIKNNPATTSQLQLIKLYSKGSPPQVASKEEAEELINSLRKGK